MKVPTNAPIPQGSFSRYDHTRDHSLNAVVRSLHTVLPASARDVYYRDEIGNISTSNLRVRHDSVEVDLRPRFPLFGGWKTHYKLGYNVPSYEYLFHSGEQFALKMRLLDHVFDDMVVEELVTKVILPEGVTDVQLRSGLGYSKLHYLSILKLLYVRRRVLCYPTDLCYLLRLS